MGKASGKKRKCIHPAEADENRILKSSKRIIAAQIKEEAQKPPSKSTLLLTILIIIFIVLSCFAVYSNSLFNGFVFDDTTQVLKNPWVTDIRYVPEIFLRSVWAFQKGHVISNYYRPLMHIIYMFDYHIFGLKPWGFHFVNVLFHAGVSVLVFIIIIRLLREYRPSSSNSYHLPSSMAALLFATHPIHTESVTWIAGLPDLSFTLFYLLSFYLYILSKGGLNGSYLFSVALFALAPLCKEPALTLPIILIAYDFGFRKSRGRFSNLIMRYSPYLAVAGLYYMVRVHALGSFAPEEKHQELSMYQYAINVFPLFSQYLEKLFFPVYLNAFYILHPIISIFEIRGIASLIITVAFAVLTFIAAKKDREIFFGLVLTSVPLLPVLYIPVLGDNSFAERYLYLPSFGFAFLFALLLARAKISRPKAAISLTIVFVMLIGLYSLGTVSRNTVWKDDYTFYTDTIKKSPDSAVLHYNFGVLLQKREGKIDEAIEQFQIALRLNPDYDDAHNNLGVSLFNKGQTDKAIEQFQIALQLNPNQPDAHNNMGYAFLNKGWIDEAIEQFQIALQLDPDHVRHNNLGLAFLNKGWIDRAIEQFQIALQLNPDYAYAHNNLGLAFLNKGWIDRAIEQYQIALQLKPDYANAHNNLGLAFLNRGWIDRAIEQYQAAAKLDPTHSNYRINLDRAYELKSLIVKK